MNRRTDDLARVEVQPTGKCNLDCGFCESASCGDLSKKIWLDFLEDAIDYEPKRISVTGGGEPLLRPDLVSDISKKIKEKEGISGDIVTNGSFFPEELVERLVEDRWDFISMSIHSPFAQTCDNLRGRQGSFKKTIENAKVINSLKEKNDADKPYLNFVYVITKQNQGQVKEAIELCKEVGFDALTMRLVEGQGNEEFLPTSEKELKGLISEVQEISKRRNLGINLQFDENDIELLFSEEDDEDEEGAVIEGKTSESLHCYSPFFEVVVFPNGKAAPCCIFHSHEGVQDKMPNIKDNNFSEIWKGKFQEFREAMAGRKELLDPCKECLIASQHRSDSWEEYKNKGESDYV